MLNRVLRKNFINSISAIAEGADTMKITFAQALKDKYVDQVEFDNRLTLPKDNKITTQITFVGFGTVTSIQKQLKRLTTIDLSSECIEIPGDLEELGGCLNRVQMLNLADNLLTWHGIIPVLSHLPNLKELIISGNLLGHEASISNLPIISTKGLVSLTLGKVYLHWCEIIKTLSRIWTHLEQLDLWDNRLSGERMKLNPVEGMGEFVRHIRILKLSHNNFVDLSWIIQIGPTDNLTELDLSNCQLQSIDIDEPIAKQLYNLTTLNVSYNNIDNWRSISSFNKLNNLRNLICFENPVYISEKFAKFLTIGRLSKLKVLNREEITSGQRRDSEIFYLRRTFPDYLEFQNCKKGDFSSQHSRYEELIEIFGLPEDLIKKQVIDKYINVELCLGDKRIAKKLPCDMRVANVKMLCKRLFNLKSSNILGITCCEAEPSKNAISYVLDKDGQTLHFFSVKSGHRLLIELE